jgi:hypothetical protein
MPRWIAMLGIALCAGCAAEMAARAHSTSADPIVGRLKTRNGTIDLTTGSFAPERDGIPREAIASEVMADIDIAPPRSTGAMPPIDADRRSSSTAF